MLGFNALLYVCVPVCDWLVCSVVIYMLFMCLILYVISYFGFECVLLKNVVIKVSMWMGVFINTFLFCFSFCWGFIVGIEVVVVLSLLPLGPLCRLKSLLCRARLLSRGLPLFC